LRSQQMGEHDPCRGALRHRAELNGRPGARQRQERWLERSTFLWHRWVGVFDDVEREPVPELHAGGTEDGAHGASGSALLADHFADVALGNAQPYDGRIAFVYGLY
jgi:hypothetical protein